MHQKNFVFINARSNEDLIFRPGFFQRGARARVALGIGFIDDQGAAAGRVGGRFLKNRKRGG